MTGNDIFTFLNLLFPCETACDFDNPGFLVGDKTASVTKVLVALDCDRYAVEKAHETGCNLILTHHPVIFGGIRTATADSIVYQLIRNGISCISMHTNLDIAENGVSDTLCRAIELTSIEPYAAHDGFLLRRGCIAPTDADSFALRLKEALGGNVRYVGGTKPIQKILVCSGSGGEFLAEVLPAGCDALVTADIKHNVLIDAVNAGISVFDAGHFHTEDVIVEPLADLLRSHFPTLTVITHHSEQIKCI